jgi:hypothetical protein
VEQQQVKESGQSNIDLQWYILLPDWLVRSFTSESRKCQKPSFATDFVIAIIFHKADSKSTVYKFRYNEI